MTTPTRRDRLRQATLDEITAAAREELDRVGAAALSLRAVARAVGLTPSAIYRYFPSRDHLLTTLIEDGFASLADALEASYATAPTDPMERWVTVAGAYRRWSLDHRTEYVLIFGKPVPGWEGQGAKQAAEEEAVRAHSVLFRVMADGIAGGLIDPGVLDPALPAGLRAQFERWRGEQQIPLSPAALAACMLAWSQLHGAIALEVYGHFPPVLGQDVSALFDFQMRQVCLGLRRRG